MRHSQPLFRLPLVFFKETLEIEQQINVKNSIQVQGFKLTTFRTSVSSNNYQPRAPAFDIFCFAIEDLLVEGKELKLPLNIFIIPTFAFS